MCKNDSCSFIPLKTLRENSEYCVYQLPNSVQDEVDDLLANGVVPPGIVIGSIFLACDELLRVEELAVGASANFIWKRREPVAPSLTVCRAQVAPGSPQGRPLLPDPWDLTHITEGRRPLTNDGRFQVDKHCPGHMLARARLTEEGVEGVISSPNGLVTWHLAIGLDAVFQAVELPAGIADLDASLANVDGDALTLPEQERENVRGRTLRNDSHLND